MASLESFYLPEEDRLRLVSMRPVRRFFLRSWWLLKGLLLKLTPARRRVLEADYHRSRFVRDYFHKDPDDPALYDLTLNVCRISAADCARIIVGALEALRVAGAFASAPMATASHA